ncbi:MAG TPA: response regulator transcription factor [Polyangiaceae bacterium]|jgi:DNA-binding response OmpR family regulator|nr:response regulator transcription factor [Polyangiaceae bacterium]
MRILLCEDHDSIRGMIQILVEASGHEVVGVATGDKAVERALKEDFDVLLLDLMLPGMDGFDVCEHMRADDKTKGMPIFIISAMDDPGSRERAKKSGATAFYGKPFNPIQLLEDIADLARSKR